MKQSAEQTASTLTRRSFVAAAAATSAVVAAGGADFFEQEALAETGVAEEGAFGDCDVVYGCCSPECQHHLLKGYIRDGKLVKIAAAEVNEGVPCLRGMSRAEICNSPMRLTKPLKLVGPKGSGEFEEIEWDEAFDLIQEKLQYALDNGGSQSICWTTGSGNFSNLTANLPGAFFSWLGGATGTVGNTCCAGIDAGVTTICGKRSQPTRNEFSKSDYIIAWGNNPVVSLSGYFGRFQEMMDNGGTLCTIDPFYSETADKSQEWIQPWPGSDSAVALAMLKIIIDEELYDAEYLIAHTTAPCLMDKETGLPFFADPEDDATYQVYDPESGEIVAHDMEGVVPPLSVEGTDIADKYVTIFDLIRAEADKWDAEAVEAESGCSYEDISRIAHGYAAAEHAMIIQNMGGYQRTENGAYATATQVYLALFTGNIGHEGDGVYDIGGVSSLVKVNPPYESNPDAQSYPGIPRVHFGEWILEEQPCKINFMWISTSNMVSQWPNSNMLKKGLEAIPFVVKVDQFMNATGLWSDLVLPCTAVFETDNVNATSRSANLALSEAKVTPPGEAKSDLAIMAELAERFGFGQYFNEDPSVYIKRVIADSGYSYEELVEQKGIITWPEGWIAYKDGNFYTSTGKAHLFVQSWVDQGYPGIACHQRPVESPLNTDGLAATYPLAAVQRKTFYSIHTTFANLESMRALNGGKPTIIIHPADAEARGIANGDAVVAYNDRGEHAGVAFVTDHVKQGVVVLQNGWDDTTASSSSHVTNNAYPTLGTIHCCNSTLIEVKKEA